MLLSKPQQQTFWRLWSKACRVNNTPSDDEHRRAFLRKCGFDSLTKVDRVDGFTKVKNELLVLIGESVDAGIESEDLSINRARVFRHTIRTEILPCLALYEPSAEGYMRTVMEDKNRWWKMDRPKCDITLEDLKAVQLKQLLMTLNARLHSKRRATGQTIHDMKIAAGVDCDCAECRKFVAQEVLDEEVDVENTPF